MWEAELDADLAPNFAGAGEVTLHRVTRTDPTLVRQCRLALEMVMANGNRGKCEVGRIQRGRPAVDRALKISPQANDVLTVSRDGKTQREARTD